jgi:hypothetical protein
MTLPGGRLALLQDEIEGNLALDRLQPHGEGARPVSADRPVLGPDTEGPNGGAGEPEGIPHETHGGMEALSSDIGDGEVRHVDLRGGPCRCPRRRQRCLRETEEGELKAEATPGGRCHVAREIPPLRPVRRMGSVILRENEGSWFDRSRISRRRTSQGRRDRHARPGVSRRVLAHGCERGRQQERGASEHEQQPSHSSRRASGRDCRTLRRAGAMLARRAATTAKANPWMSVPGASSS